MSKIVLVVGHSYNNVGACNKKFGISEFGFYRSFFEVVKEKLNEKNIECSIKLRNNYKDLPYEINKEYPKCRLIVSGHANAFNKKVSGIETLYYSKSSISDKYASIFQTNFVEDLKLNNRGIKSVNKKDNGGHILGNTNSPCILIEPFFIDNDKDCEVIFNNYIKFINSFVLSIIQCLELNLNMIIKDVAYKIYDFKI